MSAAVKSSGAIPSRFAWRLITLAIGCVLAVTGAGCRSGGGPSDPVPGLVSVVISPASGTIRAGDTVRYVAAVSGYSGVATITWQAQDTTVASVANGLVTGIAEGTTEIVAMLTAENAIRGAARVTVTR